MHVASMPSKKLGGCSQDDAGSLFGRTGRAQKVSKRSKGCPLPLCASAFRNISGRADQANDFSAAVLDRRSLKRYGKLSPIAGAIDDLTAPAARQRCAENSLAKTI